MNDAHVSITVARAILIHSIIRGEDVRVEDIIADNMAVIAQGLQGKGNLSFPSTIYKLCKDAVVMRIDTHFTVVLLDTIRYTCRDLGFVKSDLHVFGAVAGD
ncbi:hypothetical protein PIB30_090465 [Stylosanthes scabra]|uniref:Uncharacterized protein n=1 Tax=Stylosanthes scabra TaxID=79078 RepID=A0ABU6WUA0_9FABA|nr:hypothetical protein [Stylosanthes scabra]